MIFNIAIYCFLTFISVREYFRVGYQKCMCFADCLLFLTSSLLSFLYFVFIFVIYHRVFHSKHLFGRRYCPFVPFYRLIDLLIIDFEKINQPQPVVCWGTCAMGQQIFWRPLSTKTTEFEVKNSCKNLEDAKFVLFF